MKELLGDGTPRRSKEYEVSVVMPCLNEADTLGACISKARRAFEMAHIKGEIIVADNGSTDGSVRIAEKSGVVVVNVTEKGYGHALMGGIEAARGKYIIMGDADDSYDFLEIPKFVEKLQQGYELVQGCRLPAGGGNIRPDAMPFTHRWIGNPLFSWLVRTWFDAPINDVYCGLRGFTKELYKRLDQRCTGMEFATEMIIKSSLFRAKIAEVPITLHKDGRVSHPPHLHTLRDGWRTLRFFLLYSPKWLFLVPGLVLMGLGALGYVVAFPQGAEWRGVHFDVHTLLFASAFIICGYQAVVFSLFTRTFGISERLMPDDEMMSKLSRWLSLETGVGIGLGLLIAGVGLLGYAFNLWRLKEFGDLDYSSTMRWVIPGATCAILGLQTFFSSFFLGVLRLARKAG